MNVYRYRPDELLEKYQAIRVRATDQEFFRAPKHKKTQEMWCAAHFARGYEKHFAPCFVYIAESDEQTEADFDLEIAGVRYPFQITELMEPGRRRGDEYRAGPSGKTTLEDWTEGTEKGAAWVREAIERKVQKHYSSAFQLNLLVYLNFRAYEQQFNMIKAECEAAAQHFAAVWLLNGNAICCIRTSPRFRVTRGWLMIPESPAYVEQSGN